MPVAGNTQPYGLLHGGASVVLAETLGSLGAALHAGPGRVAVGLDINATHHRAARAGHVRGVATPLQLGRTLASYEVVITDDEGPHGCAPPGSPACCAPSRPGAGGAPGGPRRARTERRRASTDSRLPGRLPPRARRRTVAVVATRRTTSGVNPSRA